MRLSPDSHEEHTVGTPKALLDLAIRLAGAKSLIGPAGAVAIPSHATEPVKLLYVPIAWGELFSFCHEYLHLRHSPFQCDKHAC